MKYDLVQGPSWGQYTLVEIHEPTVQTHGIQIGDIVVYKLTAQDAEEINRRRTNGIIIKERIENKQWHVGAQAHIGNEAEEGQEFPMIIVRIWSPSCVNGQVWLDGNDTLWKTSVGDYGGNGSFYKP